MKTQCKTEAAVFDFVSRETGCDRSRLKPDTSLIKLGLDGEDAREFMQEFGHCFAVDIRNFDFSNHFGNEGVTPVMPLMWLASAARWLVFRNWAKAIGKIDITIDDLINAVQIGRWESPLHRSVDSAGITRPND